MRSSWIRVALNPTTGVLTEEKPHEDGGRGWSDAATAQGHLVPQRLDKPGRILPLPAPESLQRQRSPEIPESLIQAPECKRTPVGGDLLFPESAVPETFQGISASF